MTAGGSTGGDRTRHVDTIHGREHRVPRMVDEVFVSERESGVHTGEIDLMGDDVGGSRSTPQLG